MIDLSQLNNLKVYEHNRSIFTPLIVHDTQEISTDLYRIELRSSVLLPPNTTPQPITYHFELYIEDVAANLMATVIVGVDGDLPIEGGTFELTLITFLQINNAEFHNPYLRYIGQDDEGRLTWKSGTIVGLPEGGHKGQKLIKNSCDDFDADFANAEVIDCDTIRRLVRGEDPDNGSG